MTNPPGVRSALARAALALTPPSIRDRLVAMPTVRQEYLLPFDPVVSFHAPDFSIQRKILFGAVRDVLTTGRDLSIRDAQNEPIAVTLTIEAGGPPIPVLVRGPTEIPLPYLAALSPDAETRQAVLRSAARAFCLNRHAENRWRDVLADHSLTDEEMTGFYDECMNAPIAVVDTIRKRMEQSNLIEPELVPESEAYFTALIGTFDGSKNVDDYATREGAEVFRDWLDWSQEEGLAYSLLLAAHPALTARLAPYCQSVTSDHSLWPWVQNVGDRLSQVGAIEVGFSVVESQPDMEPVLASMLKQLLADDSTEEAGELQIYRSLYMYVDAELSRSRRFAEAPPFYRRLAASSHASLLWRVLRSSGSNAVRWDQREFASAVRRFYLQSLVDLRIESRWTPDQCTIDVMRDQLLHRVAMAAERRHEHLQTDELRRLVAELISRVTDSAALRAQKAGPFDGAIDDTDELPHNLCELLDGFDSAEAVNEQQVTALLFASRWFGLEVKYADAVAGRLVASDYSLSMMEGLEGRSAAINALATVAAATRSHALGDAVAVLLRRYRRGVPNLFSCQETMMVGLVAAASRSDKGEWMTLVGGLLTELALSDLTLDEADELHADLRELCDIVPDLWMTCGGADAALSAFRRGTTGARDK